MRRETIHVADGSPRDRAVPVEMVHTLVLGSGAAGLNAAVQLKTAGIEDLLIVTEGLQMGTSINTGSDKQTYYKLSLAGDQDDSPLAMAETYFAGGGMHGDLALVEAACSARAFLNLVNLGLPFPRDAYGQFVGYKTDHDPRGRATSIGPYTSREMCRALIRQIQRLEIPIRENCNCVQLLLAGQGQQRRVIGAICLDRQGELRAIGAENVVFAVGGPGGLYHTSVYPQVHTGAIGLALAAGAAAQNLPESQFGLASIKFRWNVSGSFMQVVPRFISTAADGHSDPREFLTDYFDDAGQACSMIFLKGYQWPFDSRKVVGGSSIIDILVYIETVQKGRRVFLDFRSNAAGFKPDELAEEAFEYLRRSRALGATPIERLRQLNPPAIELYAEHGIDIAAEPLEIAVCAQHNNGGLAGNHWWESVNLKHLFPIGEVNGSQGVYRPGGSALNAGQVGSLRAAEYIVNRYAQRQVSAKQVKTAAAAAIAKLLAWIDNCSSAEFSWRAERREFQRRMSKAAAHIRKPDLLQQAVAEAWRQYARIEASGCRCGGSDELREALRNRHLCLAHAVYLEAVLFALQSGAGSRGSAMVVDPDGDPVHPKLDESWRIAPEDPNFRDKVLETLFEGGRVSNRWVARRPIPQGDLWFETAWSRFRSGEIYEV